MTAHNVCACACDAPACQPAGPQPCPAAAPDPVLSNAARRRARHTDLAHVCLCVQDAIDSSSARRAEAASEAPCPPRPRVRAPQPVCVLAIAHPALHSLADGLRLPALAAGGSSASCAAAAVRCSESLWPPRPRVRAPQPACVRACD